MYRCLDNNTSMTVPATGSGRVQSAPSNLVAESTIEYVGAGDQGSDTTFSQMLPLGVVSNPE